MTVATRAPRSGQSKAKSGGQGASPRAAHASLYGCALIGERFEDPVRLPVQSSRSAGRRRRLRRGYDRWYLDRQWRPGHVRRTAHVTLTTVGLEYEESQGRIMRFTRAMRDAFGEQDYFWWLELQRNGQLHYHMLWLNPPSHRTKLNVAWVQHEWGKERTQIRWRDGRSFRQGGSNYIQAYAKKIGDKSYQQDYDGVPSAIRTFGSQRLEWSAKDLDEHTDRAIVAFIPDRIDAHQLVPAHLLVVGVRRHVVDDFKVGAQARGLAPCPPMHLRRPPRLRPGRRAPRALHARLERRAGASNSPNRTLGPRHD